MLENRENLPQDMAEDYRNNPDEFYDDDIVQTLSRIVTNDKFPLTAIEFLSIYCEQKLKKLKDEG